jgi:hypothetical protein
MKSDMYFRAENRKSYELLTGALCILLFITRAAIPFLKLPFIVLFLGGWVYITIRYRDKIIPGIKNLFRNFQLILFLLLYLIAAFLLSDKIYLNTAKDILNVFILITIIFMLKVFVTNTKDLEDFKKIFLWLVVILSVLVSADRIHYFLYITSYSDQYNDLYLHLNREIVDSNFALVPVFLGVIVLMYNCRQKLTVTEIILYTILLLFLSLAVLLSGSKRGAFLFFLIIAGNLLLQPASIWWKNSQLTLYTKNIRSYLIAFLLLIFVSVILVLDTQVYFKNRVLEELGVRNVSFTKNLISETIFKYVHFLNKGLNENIIYSKVWKPVFDPKDPEAWYGNGNYRIAKKLSGKNIEIVPAGSKGYLLDKSCLGFASPGHSYFFLPVKDETTSVGDSITASVYCYVSEEFDGNGAALRAEGAITGNPDEFYNLTGKGCWQKLVLRLKCSAGTVKFYLYMNKAGVKDFSNLNGYVIFAYPEIVKNSVGNLSISTPKWAPDLSDFTEHLKESGYSVRLCNIPPQKRFTRISETSLAFPLTLVYRSSILTMDSDPIRNWFAKLVSEDTTYHKYKANLNYEITHDNFGEDRTMRWKFALEIFSKEYSLRKKIFGGGFNFQNWYGKCFLGDKTKTDYPHNPFLHILLYSGILGLVIYLYMLFRVVYLYIKYIKAFLQFFLFFILTYYFTLFSGGNPFDPPVMGFLVMFPFFINSVFKEELSQQMKSL